MTSTCCPACGLIQLAGPPNCKRCGQPFATATNSAAPPPPFGAAAADNTRPYAPDAANTATGESAHAPQEPAHESPYAHTPYGQSSYGHAPHGRSTYTYSPYTHSPYTSSTQGSSTYPPPPPPHRAQGAQKSKGKVAVLVVLGIVLLGAFGALPTLLPNSPPRWQPYTDPGRNFSVQVPKLPISKVKPLNTGVGTLQAYETVVDLNDNEACVILYTDYPASFKDKLPSEALQDAVDGMADDRFTLLSETPISLGDVQGLEVEMLPPADVVANGQAYSRLYYVGTRLYIIMLLGPKDGALVRERARFFDSFQLLATAPH